MKKKDIELLLNENIEYEMVTNIVILYIKVFLTCPLEVQNQKRLFYTVLLIL